MDNLDNVVKFLRQTKKYAEGYQAFNDGKELCDNPHPVESEHGIAWDLGWADADNDARLD